MGAYGHQGALLGVVQAQLLPARRLTFAPLIDFLWKVAKAHRDASGRAGGLRFSQQGLYTLSPAYPREHTAGARCGAYLPAQLKPYPDRQTNVQPATPPGETCGRAQDFERTGFGWAVGKYSYE